MRRVIVVGIGLTLGLLAAFNFAPTAAVTQGAQDEAAPPISSSLTGQGLIDELGLSGFPMSGTAGDVDCKFSMEFDGEAYCLDPVATDWGTARLIAAQVRGEFITPELVAVAEAHANLSAASDALSQAISSGASESELDTLATEYLLARDAFNDAGAALDTSPAG